MYHISNVDVVCQIVINARMLFFLSLFAPQFKAFIHSWLLQNDFLKCFYFTYILATTTFTYVWKIFITLSASFPLSWANETVIALSWKDLYIQSLWCYYLLLTLLAAIWLFVIVRWWFSAHFSHLINLGSKGFITCCIAKIEETYSHWLYLHLYRHGIR